MWWGVEQHDVHGVRRGHVSINRRGTDGVQRVCDIVQCWPVLFGHVYRHHVAELYAVSHGNLPTHCGDDVCVHGVRSVVVSEHHRADGVQGVHH